MLIPLILLGFPTDSSSPPLIWSKREVICEGAAVRIDRLSSDEPDRPDARHERRIPPMENLVAVALIFAMVALMILL